MQILETRLTQGRTEVAAGRRAAGQARLDALEKESAARGFGLVAAKARRARGKPQ